jgi:hypothetical protein
VHLVGLIETIKIHGMNAFKIEIHVFTRINMTIAIGVESETVCLARQEINKQVCVCVCVCVCVTSKLHYRAHLAGDCRM